jgi:hypothetical protein
MVAQHECVSFLPSLWFSVNRGISSVLAQPAFRLDIGVLAMKRWKAPASEAPLTIWRIILTGCAFQLKQHWVFGFRLDC